MADSEIAELCLQLRLKNRLWTKGAIKKLRTRATDGNLLPVTATLAKRPHA